MGFTVILNSILSGLILFFIIHGFGYIKSVITYAIVKTIITIILSVFGGSGFAIVRLWFEMFKLYFVIGLLVILIIKKIMDYFDESTIIYFIIIFTIIDILALKLTARIMLELLFTRLLMVL